MGNSQGKPVDLNGEGKLHHSRNPLLHLLPSRISTRTCLQLSQRHHPNPSTNHPVIVNLNHFRLLRVVGRGAFGKVRIVERKDTNLSFALKYIRKDEGM